MCTMWLEADISPVLVIDGIPTLQQQDLQPVLEHMDDGTAHEAPDGLPASNDTALQRWVQIGTNLISL